jgi:hypothetical protein
VILLPKILMPAQSDINFAELARAEWLAEEEIADQKTILQARKYHGGEHPTFLTDRLKEFLDVGNLNESFRLNVCRPVVSAITERMSVTGFDVPGGELTTEDGSTTNPQADWAWEVWQFNRMDEKQDDVHDGTVRDGEFFVLVDWDDEHQMPRFTPHQRFTDAQAEGDDEGCKAFYANGDPSQELLYVAKRWTEDYFDNTDKLKTRKRQTLYFPDRVEKYFLVGGKWERFTGDGDAGIVPWVDAKGKPLGIAARHFKNKDLRPEATEAFPIQNGINKSYIDFLAAMDSAGLPIRYTLGFTPTSDGKPLAADLSNAAKIVAGVWLHSNKGPQDAAVDVLEAMEPTKLLDGIDRQILYVAAVTDTPVSRFQFTRQVAAEGTLKEQSEPLFAKIEKRQVLIGNGWEDCMMVGRRLANLKLQKGFDEAHQFQTKWTETRSRTAADQKAEAEAQKAANVPDEEIWRDVFRFDEKKIARMKQTEEYKARLAALGAVNLGNANAG